MSSSSSIPVKPLRPGGAESPRAAGAAPRSKNAGPPSSAAARRSSGAAAAPSPGHGRKRTAPTKRSPEKAAGPPPNSTNYDAADALGDQILKLLLAATTAPSHSNQQARNDDDALSFRWKPLVSRHNWSVLRASLRPKGGPRRKSIPASCLALPCSVLRCLVANEDCRPTWRSTIVFFVRLLACGLVAVSVCGTFVLVWCAQFFSLLCCWLLFALVEWEYIQTSKSYQVLTACASRFTFVLDSVILQGGRFAGRDWNETEYVFVSDRATTPRSREASLWDLPPPRTKPAEKWSSRTVTHMEAILYCHAMLENEHVRIVDKGHRKDACGMDSSLAQPFSDDHEDDALRYSSEGKRRSASMGSGVDVPYDSSSSMLVDSRPRVVAIPPEQMFGAGQESGVAIETVDRRDFADGDMAWIDVGAKIGMRLLHSEHLQRAIASQETKGRILETIGNKDPRGAAPLNTTTLHTAPVSELRKQLSIPFHSMWSSPSAAGQSSILAPGSYAEQEVTSEETDLYAVPLLRQSQSFPASPSSSRSLLSPKSPDFLPEQVLSDSLPVVSPLKSPEWKLQRHFSDSTRAIDGHGSPLSAKAVPCTQRMNMPGSLGGASVFHAGADSRIPSSVHAALPLKNKGRHRGGLVKNCRIFRRAALQPGIKVAVPIFPLQPRSLSPKTSYQMTTVLSSSRIYVGAGDSSGDSNCLSVTVQLEKCFLRNGEFSELTFRVMDDWSPRYMPRHSKVPIGACIATSFGIGVLVGWRVEDDCHVVRSLWQCRGSGSAHAHLNRHAIHSTTVAAVGFRVQTMFGWGVVVACVNGGTTFESCRFLVEICEEGRHMGNVLDLDPREISSCHGAQFLPVIEHVRAAALYQIQVDNYNAAFREQRLDDDTPTVEQEFLRSWSACTYILWNSFLKAVDEDKDFDEGVNDFMSSIVTFLDRLDRNDGSQDAADLNDSCRSETKLPVSVAFSGEIEVELTPVDSDGSTSTRDMQEPGFWIMNDLFGGIFRTKDEKDDSSKNSFSDQISDLEYPAIKEKKTYFDRAFAVLRTLMKTVSIARAASVDQPHFRLSLAICYDFLLFVRTILKVQQRNTSVHSLKVWKRAWEEIVSTFGPIKERLESIGRGMAYRMEHQGRKAKIRVLKFVDKILGDERLLFSLEQGDWDRCLSRLEIALVEAQIIEAENLFYYRKASKFVFEHMQMVMGGNGGAASRNSEKLALLAHVIQSLASPRRSILKFFCRDDMLELFERILLRAYNKEEVAIRMLTIHAANFHTLRHLRMLKDFSVAGRIWIPLLNAADEEFAWLVSALPEKSKRIILPLSKLFSLCVAQFHKMNAGDLSGDWLAFLLEEDSVRIVHDIDMRLILALESFSRDVREMMTVLPYYASIDDDILNLMDEVNLDEFLREASNAIDDPDTLSQYIREKAVIALERFLNYLPKMSIPVDKRELGDGWVLSCHGEDGGGLTLSDVTISRENLVCQVMGGESIFSPTFGDGIAEIAGSGSTRPLSEPVRAALQRHTPEESILDHIRVLILNAQRYGCWKVGVGGVCQPPKDRFAASVFRELPVSNVLNCGIELWRNLEIDDDELLEIAIRDISYHIQLQKERGEGTDTIVENFSEENSPAPVCISDSTSYTSLLHRKLTSSSSFEGPRHRFNPRVDPTVLFLEIKSLTLNLENFYFRIEKGDKKTIFDPVFAGRGMLSLHNVSIRLRVECARERVRKPGLGIDISTPILQLRDLEVTLDKLQMTVKDTGFGSDWILNKAVEVFEEKLTEAVEASLKDQIQEQAQNAIESLNSYFLINPSLVLNLLGIAMEDLDENVVLWV